MKHSRISTTLDTPHAASMSDDKRAPVTRRRFLTIFSAGATSLALQACGGGGGSSTGTSTGPVGSDTPSTPVTPTTPTTPNTPATPTSNLAWGTVPTISFTQGVPGSISVAQWLTGADGAAIAISLNSAALPPGVTFNPVTKTLDYDGTGAVATTDGHVLTAIGG